MWQAADDMGYPYGPVFRLLILTGQREREVADMSWSEIDLKNRLWTIPAGRMKGGRAHEVPLSPMAIALLESMLRFTAGDFEFTTTAGAKAVNGFSKAKGHESIGWAALPVGRSTIYARTMRTHFGIAGTGSRARVGDRARQAGVAQSLRSACVPGGKAGVSVSVGAAVDEDSQSATGSR